jgi:hypothetical protein
MKSLFTSLGKIIIVLLIFSAGKTISAQSPTYLLKIANESQPSPTTYEFDVFLLNTNSVPFELHTFQFGLGYDISMLNGGVPSYSIVNVVNGNPSLPAVSELNDAQKPTTLPVDQKNSKISNQGLNYRYLNCATRTPPGPAKGTIISNVDDGCTHPGTRVARYRITNSVPFRTNSTGKLTWSFSQGFNRANTIVQAYVNGVAANITSGASHLNYNQDGSCILEPNGLLINATTGINTTADKTNEGLNSLVAYPNPTTGKATITFNSDREGKYSLKVMDPIGRVLITEIISALKGYNMKEINLANVSKGMYLVSVQSEGKSAKSLRLIVE